jgi:hypothetical protein
MTTLRQAEANHRNARHITEPRTDQRKGPADRQADLDAPLRGFLG